MAAYCMSKKILLFNIIFYFVTLRFFFPGRQDASSSLGYGFFIIIFWVIALVTLIILLIKKIIQPKTIADKIGIVTATPILCVVAVGLILTFNDTPSSIWYFNKDNHRYKVNSFNYSGTGKLKRIEYYKSSGTVNPGDPFANTEKWVKDSTWIYFSESGGKEKVVKYKNGLQIK
jgi:glucan phosphoethanolaminetransferase (alkaline phosphatase superfamily)